MFAKILLRGLLMCAIVALCATPVMAQTGEQNLGSWEKLIGLHSWEKLIGNRLFEKLIARLEKDNFIVTAGDPIKFDPIGKYCDGNYPNALYANYGAPYTAAALGPSPRFLSGLPQPVKDVALELPIFRLAPDEAVVLVGLTPPPEAYFSYQIYLATRWYTSETTPGEAKIELLLNSLGDTVNMQTINTIGRKPFERPMVFIFTADRGIDARVRAALRRAGYPASIINTIVVPSATLKLGFESDSDTFIIANRNALWVDPVAGEAYVENPTYRVLRLTPEPEAVLDPFPTPPLRIRGTGQTEIDLTPTLARLRAAIIQHYTAQGYTEKEYITKTVAYEGYDFTQRKVTTLGDTRDALYLGAGNLPEFGLTDPMTLTEGDELLIAYGLNHMATGKATYVNLNTYTSGPSKMALGRAFPDDLEGSAYQYLSPSDPDGEVTYAYMISRNCEAEDFCLQLEVPVDGCKNKDGTEILTDDSPLGVVFRLYVEPPTSIGAAFPEVVYDQVIKFTR
jgi:hypothetical protein